MPAGLIRRRWRSTRTAWKPPAAWRRSMSNPTISNVPSTPTRKPSRGIRKFRSCGTARPGPSTPQGLSREHPLPDQGMELEPENRDYMKKLGFTLAWMGQIDQGLNYLTRAQGRAWPIATFRRADRTRSNATGPPASHARARQIPRLARGDCPAHLARKRPTGRRRTVDPFSFSARSRKWDRIPILSLPDRIGIPSHFYTITNLIPPPSARSAPPFPVPAWFACRAAA